MAGSVNKVILVGNLGADPEIKAKRTGGKVAQFRIATSDTWRDKTTGERKQKTEWHTIAVFSDGLVEVVEKYLKKGAKVYVEGKLATNKWTDQAGVERYSTSVNVEAFGGTITMLDSNGTGRPPHAADQAGDDDGRPGVAPRGSAQRTAANPNADMDDDIPF
jgi:single-strand DNA-binding protein